MYFCISVFLYFSSSFISPAPSGAAGWASMGAPYRNTEIHLPSSFYTKHTINIKGHTPHQHMHSAGQPTASAQECAKDHCHHCDHLVYSCSAGTARNPSTACVGGIDSVHGWTHESCGQCVYACPGVFTEADSLPDSRCCSGVIVRDNYPCRSGGLALVASFLANHAARSADDGQSMHVGSMHRY